MDYRWAARGNAHGLGVGCAWDTHGLGDPWVARWIPIGFRWGLPVRIGCLWGWDADGVSVGMCMGCPRAAHGQTMACP